MAAVRRWYIDAEWIDHGYVWVRQSNNSFLISSTATDIFTARRRVRMIDGGVTIYGEVLSSSPSGANTLITVSSSNLSSSLSSGSVGILNPNISSVPAPALPNDYISGFGLTTASTTTYDIAAGQAIDSTNTTNILGSAITAKSQAAWVAGSTAGGKLSAAAMANNTWYYWFALWKTADGTVDYGFDVATTPTLPVGYTKYRYIGARKTDLAATTWPTFIQHGDEVLWSTPPATDLNGTVATGSRTLLTVNVPAVKVLWRGHVYLDSGAAGNQYLYITDPTVADVAPGTGAPPASPLATVGINGAASQTKTVHASSWTNTSSQIGIRSANATPTVRIQSIGWIDPRGKPV